MYEPVSRIVQKENEKQKKARRRESLWAAGLCLTVAVCGFLMMWGTP